MSATSEYLADPHSTAASQRLRSFNRVADFVVLPVVVLSLLIVLVRWVPHIWEVEAASQVTWLTFLLLVVGFACLLGLVGGIALSATRSLLVRVMLKKFLDEMTILRIERKVRLLKTKSLAGNLMDLTDTERYKVQYDLDTHYRDYRGNHHLKQM